MPNLALTTGQLLPGYWGFVDFNSQGGTQPPNLRALLWGYVPASATQPLNQPCRVTSQADANNRFGGPNSDLSRAFAACMAQPESQGADVWCMPIATPNGGVQSTYKLTVFLSGSNPTKAGTLQLWVASQQVPSVGFTTSDTTSTIATAIAAAISAAPNVPFASATAATNVVTCTYLLAGTTGEDLPIRCFLSPTGSGLNLSPGQALFATNATGAGSVIVNVGAITVTTALAGGETPAQVATKVVASWNANGYPLTAVVDGSTPAQVDFYFNALGPVMYDVRRISAAIATTTGLTVNLGSGATSGAGSPTSFTYNGTQGTGLPALATAIANLTTSSQWFRSWMVPWIDATSLGTIATYIEAASNGSVTGQKWQHVTFADWNSESVDAAIPGTVSPNLNTSAPHYGFGWSPDIPVQAFEAAARVAGARAAFWIGTPQFNWNGFRLQGNSQAPLLAPPPSALPSSDTLNAGLRAGLSPWIVGRSGNIEVVKGRTTSTAADLRLWAWSCEAQAAYHVFDLANFLASKTQGANLLRYTTPKAPNQFDANSIADLTRERMRFWELNGNYDGATAFAPSVVAVNNAVNPFRVDLDYPESPVLDLDQIAFASHFSQPSA